MATTLCPVHFQSTSVLFPPSSFCSPSNYAKKNSRATVIRAQVVVPPNESTVLQLVDPEFLCNLCNAKGWITCDFCNGQKTNVQVKNNRMYRRCPSCKAAGVLICPNCKVYRCVTFPDGQDGGFEM